MGGIGPLMVHTVNSGGARDGRRDYRHAMKKTTFSGLRVAAAAALAGLVALTAAGCGSGGSSSGSGSGQLTVLMADAPPNLGDVTAVNVTISKVEVHRSGSGGEGSGSWVTVFEGAKTFNLLDLANIENVTALPHLVDDGLPAGHYTQLRLIVATASIEVGGTTFPLVIPSGANTGLKALPFDVASQQDTVLLVDFDVARSVTRQGDGTYRLQPVIRLAPVTLTSTLTGKVVDASGAPMSAQVTLKDVGGTVVTTSVTSVSDASVETNGVFALHGLASGTYTLEVAAEGHSTVTQTVTVTAPTTTDVGNVTLTAAASTGV
jgi:hypothetical protein